MLVAFALVAAACGGSSNNGTKNPGGTGTGKTGGSSNGGGTPQRGGNLTYGIEAESTGGFCLPESQLAIAGIQVARSVYDTLVMPDDKGSFQPWLAQSFTHNATYDAWTITLRPGVTFHDGSKLDAQLVQDNIDAWRNAYQKKRADGTPMRAAQLFLFVFQNIASTEVTGPLTVVVHTKTPWIAFPAFLWSSGRLGIIARAQLDDPDHCETRLIGTGPFMLEKMSDWKVNDHMMLTRNPN